MKKFLVVLIVAILNFVFADITSAQSRVESDNFIIQFPNFNSGAGIPTSSNFKLDTTIGQTAPGLYSSTGYRVKAGFQYIHSIIPFSFSISDIRRDFGTLTAGTPSTLTSTLTVSAGGTGGYSVKASENHTLQTSSATSFIPDTPCDSGPCTHTTAQPWTSNSVYGFGFNMTGDDISADFTDATYFRQFADRSVPETEQTIMTSSEVGRSRAATITYKVNVGPVQEAGTYQNTITFTAIPVY